MVCSSWVSASGEERFIGGGVETETVGFRQQIFSRLPFDSGYFGVHRLRGWFEVIGVEIGIEVIESNLMLITFGKSCLGSEHVVPKLFISGFPVLDSLDASPDEVCGSRFHAGFFIKLSDIDLHLRNVFVPA